MATTLQKARAGFGDAKELMPCGHERCYVFLQTVPPVHCEKCRGTGKWKYEKDCLHCSGSGLEPERGYCFRTGQSFRLEGVTHSPIARLNKPIIPMASIGRRNDVYRALLDELTLYQGHQSELTARRRLPLETIAKAGFKSVPSRSLGDALAQKLSLDYELKGVSGFWRKDGKWLLRFSGINGFFIPIKNAVGQIEGLQIRTMSGDAKYLLVSSDGLTDGVSSGTPHHFTGQPCETVIVTEGALKSEVIAEAKRRKGQSDFVIGMVSVSTFADDFGQMLRRICPFVHTVQLAFDADWQTNENVQKQMERFARAIHSAKLKLEILTWEIERGKGYDDFLLRCEGE